MDNFWYRIKQDAQYQQEDVIDWAAYLEHLQVVFREFNPVAAPNKEILIQYFWEGLRPFIQAQIDSQHQELDFWDKVINKAIEGESKAAFHLATSIQEIDARCWKGQSFDKKEETSRSHKKKKPKQADNQPTTLAGTN